MKSTQHQWLPHPEAVMVDIKMSIRPDKADYLLSVHARTIRGQVPLWNLDQYFPRDTDGFASALNEVYDMLYHLSDVVNVTMPEMGVQFLNETEF